MHKSPAMMILLITLLKRKTCFMLFVMSCQSFGFILKND